MKLLRDCSTSYSLPQVRALMAATMLRELSLTRLQDLCVVTGAPGEVPWGTARQIAWRLVFRLLPAGNETRKKRREARPKQRRLPGTE